jgi:hypothetical protein
VRCLHGIMYRIERSWARRRGWSIDEHFLRKVPRC